MNKQPSSSVAVKRSSSQHPPSTAANVNDRPKKKKGANVVSVKMDMTKLSGPITTDNQKPKIVIHTAPIKEVLQKMKPKVVVHKDQPKQVFERAPVRKAIPKPLPDFIPVTKQAVDERVVVESQSGKDASSAAAKPSEPEQPVKRKRGRPKGSGVGKKRVMTGEPRNKNKGSTYNALIGRASMQVTSQRVDMNSAAKRVLNIVPPQHQNIEDRIENSLIEARKVKESIESRQNSMSRHEEELEKLSQHIDATSSVLKTYGKIIIGALNTIPGEVSAKAITAIDNITDALADIKKTQKGLLDNSICNRTGGRTDHESIIHNILQLQHLKADYGTRLFHQSAACLNSIYDPEHYAMATGGPSLIAYPFNK
jgi:hypothetical protein